VTSPKVTTGLYVPPNPPLGLIRAFTAIGRLMRFDSVVVEDHFQDFYPSALWNSDLSWAAAQSSTPHDIFDYQTLLGYLASRAGRLRLGVVVTETIRRHPVLIAQAMLTLSHMTRRPPILGIGAGERLNTEPYGLDFSRPVGRLEEALAVISLCFSSLGPIDFEGRYFRLAGAPMGLKPPKGQTPELWVAGRGPRMLRLTGEYGDGWYPVAITSPEEYAEKLEIVRNEARRKGRDPHEITPALEQHLVVAPSERQAREMLNTKVVRFSHLLFPADVWLRVGAKHPFGEEFRGYVDFVPERYELRDLEEAIAAVPDELVTEGPLMWGTPDQVAHRLTKFGEFGLRYVVLSPLSALISRRAAVFGLRATHKIARLLR
jgi:phthiodiolone/phenolphthiodiolone dimycocerosates ketoreductase